MTRKLIENIRTIVVPYMARDLRRINYENMGEVDAEQFKEDFNEILDLANKALDDEENILKFYYVESEDDYWIGRRLDTLYYAKWNWDLMAFVWSTSRYLPWGEHVVEPDTLWKEYTYPSEPKEIPFNEWIKGFVEKYFLSDFDEDEESGDDD